MGGGGGQQSFQSFNLWYKLKNKHTHMNTHTHKHTHTHMKFPGNLCAQSIIELTFIELIT